MLASTIITAVRREAVEPVGIFWQDSELLDLVNEAEMYVSQQVQPLEKKAITDINRGQAEYPLPDNFLSVAALFFNSPSNGVDSWSVLRPTQLEKEKQENPNFLSSDPTIWGTPMSYWLWNNNLVLDPISDTTRANAMVMFFKSRPIPLTAVTDSINLDDECKQAIVYYILWKMWKKAGEMTLASNAYQSYLLELRKVRTWKNKIQLDNRRKFDIDSPIPFSPASSFTTGFNPFL